MVPAFQVSKKEPRNDTKRHEKSKTNALLEFLRKVQQGASFPAHPAEQERLLFSCLKNPIKRRFGRTPEFGKSPGLDNLAKSIFAGDGAESRPAERERIWRAAQRRCGRERAADDVEIFFDRVAGHRFDYHAASVGCERFRCMFHCSFGVTHIVQTIEERDEIELLIRIIVGPDRLKMDAVIHAGLFGS